MATNSTFLSTMVIFFAFTFLLFAPSHQNEVTLSSSPSRSPNADPSVELRKFVAKCGANLSSNCGKEIRNALLEIENVSGNCCGELVKMGLFCHKAMTRLALEQPPLFNEEQTATVMSNTMSVYNRCAKTVNNIVPSPF